jgi:hypothetical protein
MRSSCLIHSEEAHEGCAPRTSLGAQGALTLRWQIELLFTEWKSYANLHAFDTEKGTIAEALTWAALCAAVLKRYCAHLTPRLLHVPISTQKVAMCGRHFLPAIFRALMCCPRQLRSALRHAFEDLSKNAPRAHPKRRCHLRSLKDRPATCFREPLKTNQYSR